jgi:hypothetical protein
MIRNRCPICFVENTGGNPCQYHFRNRARHAEAVQARRVHHWKELLCEYVDEARRHDPFRKPKQN